MVVYKRDGHYEPFDFKKIQKSIDGAFHDGYLHHEMSEEAAELKDEIAYILIRKMFTGKACIHNISSKSLREALERELMQSDYYAAKAYIIYGYLQHKGGDDDGI